MGHGHSQLAESQSTRGSGEPGGDPLQAQIRIFSQQTAGRQIPRGQILAGQRQARDRQIKLSIWKLGEFFDGFRCFTLVRTIAQTLVQPLAQPLLRMVDRRLAQNLGWPGVQRGPVWTTFLMTAVVAGCADGQLAQTQFRQDALTLCGGGRPLDGGCALVAVARVFLRHPEWAHIVPKTRKFLQRRAEKAGWTGDLSDRDRRDVWAFFKAHHPVTIVGWKLFFQLATQADARGPAGFLEAGPFQAGGQSVAPHQNLAHRLFIKTWQEDPLSEDKQYQALTLFGGLFRPMDHLRRAEMLIVSRQVPLAQALMDQVSFGLEHSKHLKVALALLAKKAWKTQEAWDLYMGSVQPIRRHPLVRFAAIRYCIRASQSPIAAEIWDRAGFASPSPRALGWACPGFVQAIQDTEVCLMRDLLQFGQWQWRQGRKDAARQAFAKALTLRQSGAPQDWAEYAWMCGFVLYAGLLDFQKAVPYFRALQGLEPLPGARGRPATKASDRYVARGAFWEGLCYERLGQLDKARQSWQRAARFSFYFYGQMAQALLGRPLTLSFASLQKESQDQSSWGHGEGQHWDPRSLDDSGQPDAGQAVGLLRQWVKIWRREKAQRGVSWAALMPAAHAIADDAARVVRTPRDRRWCLDLIGELALVQKTQTAKTFTRHQNSIFRDAYPIEPLPRRPQDPALVYGIALAETAFNPLAVSSAGARGIMQVMPEQVPRIAARAGVPASVEALAQKDYGWILGMTEIQMKLEDYGSYPMAIASYNAPAAQAVKWLLQGPLPGRTIQDAVVWIESIPFAETRAYVSRVLEHWGVYRCLLGQPPRTQDWQRVVSLEHIRLARSQKPSQGSFYKPFSSGLAPSRPADADASPTDFGASELMRLAGLKRSRGRAAAKKNGLKKEVQGKGMASQSLLSRNMVGKGSSGGGSGEGGRGKRGQGRTSRVVEAVLSKIGSGRSLQANQKGVPSRKRNPFRALDRVKP